MMAVWEQLRTHFGSNHRNQVASHSTCANIKKANPLFTPCTPSCYLSLPKFLRKSSPFFEDAETQREPAEAEAERHCSLERSHLLME